MLMAKFKVAQTAIEIQRATAAIIQSDFTYCKANEIKSNQQVIFKRNKLNLNFDTQMFLVLVWFDA